MLTDYNNIGSCAVYMYIWFISVCLLTLSQAMLGELSKARLRIPQPVKLQNIAELTLNAKERNRDLLQHYGSETLSVHVDFSADSSPDREVATYV